LFEQTDIFPFVPSYPEDSVFRHKTSTRAKHRLLYTNAIIESPADSQMPITFSDTLHAIGKQMSFPESRSFIGPGKYNTSGNPRVPWGITRPRGSSSSTVHDCRIAAGDVKTGRRP